MRPLQPPQRVLGIRRLWLVLSGLVLLGVASGMVFASDRATQRVQTARGDAPMNTQANATPSVATSEALFAIQANGTSAKAGFRVLQDDAVAGGPVSIEFVVENTGAAPAYFFTATDRSRLRPDNFSIQAGLQGSDVVFADPLANVPYLGGPGGVLKVDPGAQIRQRLLVNAFVTLEQTRDVLEPGAATTLWIRGMRPLALVATEDQALQGGAEPSQIDATLVIPIRRDDAALEALVASLADSVRADQSTTVSAQREQTMGDLVGLRLLPMVVPYLESLRDHPDAAVRTYVQRALATH